VFGDITPNELLTKSQHWLDVGASIFGGCCGIGPEHISLLAREMR
jgi:S-methylmethionine-dependent homocysteine/selenocysteine methylase